MNTLGHGTKSQATAAKASGTTTVNAHETAGRRGARASLICRPTMATIATAVTMPNPISRDSAIQAASGGAWSSPLVRPKMPIAAVPAVRITSSHRMTQARRMPFGTWCGQRSRSPETHALTCSKVVPAMMSAQ